MNAAQRDQLAVAAGGYFEDLHAFLAEILPPSDAAADLLSSVEATRGDVLAHINRLPIDQKPNAE